MTQGRTAWLVIDSGPQKGEKFALTEQTYIGSGGDVTLRLADERVRPRHALIYLRDGNFVIRPLDSSAGGTVAVNGRIISADRQLQPGDRLRLGLSWITFRDAEKSSSLDILDLFGIEEELPSDGLGDVFRAREIALDRIVCLHVLPPRLIQNDPKTLGRLREELQAVAALHHEGIAIFLDFGMHESFIFYTTELIPGTNLDDHMAKGALPTAESLLIARDVARALAHAHQQGTIHGRLSPSSVVLSGHRVAMTDFGPSRVIADLTRDGLTSMGMGSRLEYASPEQCRGEAPSPASDIYALGVILYRLLSGRLPIEGKTPFDFIEGHIKKSRVPVDRHVPDLPPEVARIVDSLLEKDAANRPAADQVVARIDRFLQDHELLRLGGPPGLSRGGSWAVGRIQRARRFLDRLERKVRAVEVVRVGDYAQHPDYRRLANMAKTGRLWAMMIGLGITGLVVIYGLAEGTRRLLSLIGIE